MQPQFPPSSPVAACQADQDDPFYQPSVKPLPSTVDFFKKKCSNGVLDYPTPNPSSTLDRSSSPIKNSSHPVHSQTHSDLELEHELRTELTFQSQYKTRPIKINFDSHLETRLSIGRKQSVCDVVLPRHKNISRLHAFATFYPETREVKLECKGTNGIVVVFPMRLDLVLTTCADLRQTFRLADKNSDIEISSKELVKDTGLTSFVLLQGEAVFMPFIENTIIDFRHAECELKICEPPSDYEYDSQNATETEDELQPLQITSDDFEPHTPVRIVTPPHLKKSSPPLLATEELLYTPRVQQERGTSSEPTHLQQSSEAFVDDAGSKCEETLPEAPQTPKKQIAETSFSENVAKPNFKSNEENIRRRKFTSPSPQKTHKRKNQAKADKSSTEEILSRVSSRNVDICELQHVLANHLAFSNVQQVPFSQLKDVNSTISTLKSEELRAILEIEQCIGVIYRQGKDAAGKPLDEEYYYDVENDSDANRRQLVSALKGGRSNLRSCRRVHKQYFWKKPAK